MILRLKGKEMGTPFLISPEIDTGRGMPDLFLGGLDDDDDDGAFNPLFGDEEAHSVVDRVAATPRAVDLAPLDPETEAADKEEWIVLKSMGWGKQLNTLKPRGWEEPIPEYNEMEGQVGRRLFVLEHGFGMLLKAPKKKRGWGPCSVEFVEGGKKTVILRLKGKEMGTPFLISPEVDTGRNRPSLESPAARTGPEAQTVECVSFCAVFSNRVVHLRSCPIQSQHAEPPGFCQVRARPSARWAAAGEWQLRLVPSAFRSYSNAVTLTTPGLKSQAEWVELKKMGWGKQLATLKPRGAQAGPPQSFQCHYADPTRCVPGWVEPDPEWDEVDSALGRNVYALELGFGTLVRVQKKKRGCGSRRCRRSPRLTYSAPTHAAHRRC